jgi:transcriptional regulator with XRE-family HTH domain
MADQSDIEKYIISKIKEIRKQRKISQEKLSILIGYSEGFIGNIENPNQPERYNIKHLNEIAKVLGCSPKDFWPETPF